MQVHHLRLLRRVTGRAGPAGPTAAEADAAGHAAVTQMGSLELRAGETPEVRSTARPIIYHLTKNLSVRTQPLSKRYKSTDLKS